MHQPRSARSARAMKLGAHFLALHGLSSLGTVLLFGYAIYSEERSAALVVLGLLVLSIVLFVTYRLLAVHAHCPLCRGPVLAGSGAQRNRRARRTFGSHRLRVARDIIFTRAFVCPYCNEATRCTPKERPGRGSPIRKSTAFRP